MQKEESMKYHSFIMRVLCLVLIIAALVGYNSMQKDETQDAQSTEIAALTKRVESLESQQEEMLTALEEAAKDREEAEAKAEEAAKAAADAEDEEEADSEEETDAEEEEETEDYYYKDGTYTGSAQGFGGDITVSVTLKADEITAITVDSAPGEDSAYLSQGENVINSIISAQSTDVDTISGATFSSTGIINAVVDALGKAENS